MDETKKINMDIISFIDKAREKGVVLKKPPTRLLFEERKLTEVGEHDVETFKYATDKDILLISLLDGGDFLVFEFFDKETKSKYRTYKIDADNFYLMNLAVHTIMERDNDTDRQ